MSRHRQRGAVLLVALAIVAIATTLAAFALQRQDVALRQLEATRDYEQARWILVGGVHWARTVLAEDARSSRTDHPRELWASGLKATEVEDATLTGELHDEQGLFNLANLSRDGQASARHVRGFKRLLATVGVPASLADAIAAAQPMVEWDDLRRIPGCSEETLARLARVATLLPVATPVNVNTAPAAVLVSLVEGLNPAEAAALAQSLRADPARSFDEFARRLPRPDLVVEASEVVAASGFFKVRGRVVLRKADVRIEALLRRQGAVLPEILWQRTS